MGNKNSKYICSQCEKGNHNECLSKISCDCICNIGGVVDVTQKLLTTTAGIAMAAGGLALTIGTGGLAIPLGGSLMGAGISSVYQGIEKAIKGERINGLEYCADVGFGAVTGILSGGIGASGEVIAANTAKEGAKKLAIRATSGAVTGITSKAVSEVKVCSTTDKKWKDYGQVVDKDGNTSTSGTIAAWTASMAAGLFGGVSTHLSSNFTSAASSGIEKATTRVVISATTGCTTDAISQGMNIAAGNQDEYDFKRTILSGTTSAITTAAMEGVENTIYAVHGGRDKFYDTKTNRELIKSKVPLDEQNDALKAYDDLQKIAPVDLDKELAKAADISKAAKTSFKKADLAKLGNSNAHALVGNKLGQVAVDVNDANAVTRGAKRLLFDFEPSDSSTGGSLKFADYTPDHNYRNTKNYGAGNTDYLKYYEEVSAHGDMMLTTSKFEQNTIILNNILEEGDDDDESEKYKKNN